MGGRERSVGAGDRPGGEPDRKQFVFHVTKWECGGVSCQGAVWPLCKTLDVRVAFHPWPEVTWVLVEGR